MNRFFRISNIVFFTIYPILYLYAGNSGFLQEGGLLFPLLIGAVFALFFYWITAKLFKGKNNRVYITVLVMLWLQLYGHVYYTIMDSLGLAYEVFKHRYFILIYVGLGCLLVYVIRSKNDVSINMVRVTAVLGLMLCSQFIHPIYEDLSVKLKNKNANPLPALQTDFPDVYYIVADSYSNKDNLQQFYGYDNNSFITELQKLGFEIQDQAKSNYPYTYFSVASSLNMEYVNYFEDSLRLSKYGDDFPFSKIHKNKVAEYFKSKGYRYVLYKSAYSQMNNEINADLYIDNHLTVNQFHEALLELSVFSVFNAHLLFDSKVYNICVKAFENLANSNEIAGSKFVFFHCLPPHPPLVFNADGSYHQSAGGVKNRYQLKNEYISQLSYVNSAILKAVERILATSKREPIIIIQGDHGTCSEEEYEDELKWNHVPTIELLIERYGILNAVYSPEEYPVEFEPGHTPVNTFKVVVNSLFNETLNLDSNIHFFSKYRAPFEFQSFELLQDSIKWGEGPR